MLTLIRIMLLSAPSAIVTKATMFEKLHTSPKKAKVTRHKYMFVSQYLQLAHASIWRLVPNNNNLLHAVSMADGTRLKSVAATGIR